MQAINLVMGDILTIEEAREIALLYRKYPNDEFIQKCLDTVVLPALDRINYLAGGKNDPLYIAKAIYFAISEASLTPHQIHRA